MLYELYRTALVPIFRQSVPFPCGQLTDKAVRGRVIGYVADAMYRVLINSRDTIVTRDIRILREDQPPPPYPSSQPSLSNTFPNFHPQAMANMTNNSRNHLTRHLVVLTETQSHHSALLSLNNRTRPLSFVSPNQLCTRSRPQSPLLFRLSYYTNQAS